MTKPLIILDLCGGTGAWSRPYAEAGYDVRLVTLPEHDVLTYEPPEHVWGVLAAPPCTEFAGSGARWWAGKPISLLHDALDIVQACLVIVQRCGPVWWAMENPVGRLRRYIGKPSWSFDPWEYGDDQFKRTLIWGTACKPKPVTCVAPERTNDNQSVWRMGPSPDRAVLRSITPPGFAKAFFESNP